MQPFGWAEVRRAWLTQPTGTGRYPGVSRGAGAATSLSTWKTSTAASSDCSLADGRMSFTDLGKATGLSTSAVHQRVRRLEERGVITGYPADRRRRRPSACRSRPSSRSRRSTRAPPTTSPSGSPHIGEIEACHSVAGVESYILKVRVLDARRTSRTCSRGSARRANVSTRTTVVLSTPWEGRSGAAERTGGLTGAKSISTNASHPCDGPAYQLAARSRSSGASSTAKPRRPPETNTVSCDDGRVVEHGAQPAPLADRADATDDVPGAPSAAAGPPSATPP